MRRTLTLLCLFLLACTWPSEAQVPVDTTGWRYTDSVPTGWRYTDSVPVLDTLKPPPPPPPPPCDCSGNEPAGGKVIADNDWAGFSTQAPALGKSLAGWTRYAAGNTGRWVYDVTAPDDPDVLEILKSGTQGTGPEHLSVAIPAGMRTLYLRVPVWLPADYTGSSSGVQKLFHLWAPFDKATAGSPATSLAVPSIFGSGTKPLEAQIRIQNATITGSHSTSFNLHGRPYTRGRWVVTEWLLKMNTPGQANGEAHLWQDGAKAITRTGITYSKAGGGWTVVQLNPTYGGTGATPNPPQRLRYGRIRVVAAP